MHDLTKKMTRFVGILSYPDRNFHTPRQEI
jgi:hypothetical protein